MSTLKTGLLYVPRLKMTNGLPTKPLREREQMEYMRKENGSYTVYVIHVYEGREQMEIIYLKEMGSYWYMYMRKGKL